MRIVFHGENAATFSHGFKDLLDGDAEIVVVPDTPRTPVERDAFATAQVIIGNRFDGALPLPEGLLLYQAPAAGYDAIDLARIPDSAVVCNCFGHEHAIAEYVMAALLRRHVPLDDADRDLRRGAWTYWAGAPERAHPEMAGSTIGILGFGHIGKAIATRARAFGMRVHVANRSPLSEPGLSDKTYTLTELKPFWASADWFVVTVPLTDGTRGLVDAEAFSVMRPHAVLINVARGPVVDEQALYDALKHEQIGGAVIDTWYRYPSADQPSTMPASLPFHELSNVLMTPHMSGWTTGTIRRRQQAMADNICHIMRGEPCVDVVRPARTGTNR